MELATQQAVLTLRECRLFAHLYACVLHFFFAALLLVAGLLPTVSACAQAQETEPAMDTLVTATLAADTIDNTDPEWYVAPVIPAPLRAPKHAPAAAACLADSVLTFNIDSVLTEVTTYAYDNAGHTICETVWTCNADGSRTGKSKKEDRYEGNTQVMTSTYVWDNTTNDWKGNAKTEYEFANGKNTLTTVFDWLNGDWSAKTQYTYAYDAAGREVEYYEYSRNASLQLVYSKGRIREYNTNAKLILEIQYSAHNGTDWSAGTKKVYDFDASNHQILYEYYSSYSNGAWVGSSKETWAFNAAGKQTKHEKFSWLNEAWSATLEENSGYDAAGNNTLIENYTISNGIYTGTKKEEYTYKGTKKTITIKYKWSNGTWVYTTKAVSDVDAAGNSIETANYNWTNGAWVGTGTRTLQTFNSSKKVTEKITQSWPTNATDWVNRTCTTTVYSGANKTQEIYATWSNDAWVGTKRTDYHYNASNKNDTTKTYTNDGTDWIYSNRTVNTFNAAGTNIMTHNAKWENGVWVMTSMTRTDISDKTENGIRQTLNASWKCNADSIWMGIQKDTAAYWNGDLNKQIYTAQYLSWSNGDWIPSYKVEIWYDEAGRDTVNQRFDWRNNSWQGHYRYEHQYNEQGKELMRATYSNWEPNTSLWIGTTKYEYTYDTNSSHRIGQTSYSWSNGRWEYLFSYSYLYDDYDHEILQIIQRYNNGSWVNSDKYEKEYNGSIQIKNNTYVWFSNNWQIYNRNETYYDEDAQAKLRRQITGSWNTSGVAQSYSDKLYSYDCDPRTIRFVNYDGTLLETQTLDKGVTPSYSGATPKREGNAEYTYTFAGWAPAIVPVTGNATYTATFTASKNTYTITWVDEAGNEIDRTTVEYGVMPTHAEPSKANTAEFSYEFTGWTPGLGIVTGDATYQATFKATKNSYTITWLNEDGSPIDQTTVEYGLTPTHTDINKDNTLEYSYTFAGWTPTVVAVTSNATYTATFEATKRKYTVTWLNEDGSIIGQEELEFGATPAHADINKENTAEYTYEFAGWTPTILPVVSNISYQATFTATKNSYTITFKDEDGTTISSANVEYGAMPVEPTTPTKPTDSENTYTFAGWAPTIVAVTGDAEYTATFTATKNSYTITWKNEDGSVIASETLKYGATPAHADIYKESTAEYTYTFAGWTPGIGIVTGDATYTATFTATKNKYTVTFKDEDGTTLKSEELEYGVTPTAPADPTKAATGGYMYTFSGWDKEVVSVTGEATYTATYTATKNSYTVTWLNEDGSVIASETLEYGATPAHADAAKDNTAEYTYTFAGWDKEIVPVEGDATYTATYDSVRNSYTVTWLNEDGSLIASETLEYGATPAHADITKVSTAEYDYTFAGWSPEIVPVTGDATYTATFDSIKRSYTVTWLNSDNSPLGTTTVEYGVVPLHEDPTKVSTAEYDYTFAGWTPTIIAVTGEATYTAVFDSIKRNYTVTWLNAEGVQVDQTTVEYGLTPTHADINKESTAEYTYTFAGWSPEIVPVTGNATYQATFDSIKNSYAITWKNEDGSQIDQIVTNYGEIPNAPSDPTKVSTAEYDYNFAGWTPSITAVTGEATYTATFTPTKRSYTITWLDAEGTQVDQTTVEYGATPSHGSITKADGAGYSYTFKAWSPALEPVTGDATYQAIFDSIAETYTVTFYYEDGVTVLDQVTVQYGETPATSLIPSKYSEEHYYYTFSGWSPEVVPAEGNASYKATFTAVPKQYTVTFKNHNGRTLLTTETPYGEIPVYTGDEPTRTKDKQYTYTFSGWSPELTEVTGPTTYTAVFEGTLNQYTVIFLDEDGTELDRQTLDYGTMPIYEGETPAKDDEGQYGYTFKGWSPKLTSVTKNATYRAVYTRYDKTQGIEDVQPPYMEAQKILIGNTIYILRGGKTYTLQGVEVR